MPSSCWAPLVAAKDSAYDEPIDVSARVGKHESFLWGQRAQYYPYDARIALAISAGGPHYDLWVRQRGSSANLKRRHPVEHL